MVGCRCQRPRQYNSQASRREHPPLSAIEIEDLRRIFRRTVGFVRRHALKVLAADDLSLEVAAVAPHGLLESNAAERTYSVKGLVIRFIPSLRRCGLLAQRRGTLEASPSKEGRK